MPRFLIGNVFLILSLLCAAAAHILIKSLVDDSRTFGLDWQDLRRFLSRSTFLRGSTAVALLGGGFVLWLLCLRKLDLSYAYPIACSSVLLVTYLSVVFLGETVTPRMWLGTALILVGIVMLMPTR